jgi:hypothetical protein
MNYLSFSLWGDKPIYNVGVIKNAELWKNVYSDWQMVVYYDNTVPIETINKLNDLGVVTIDYTTKKLYGMFWRFFAVDLPNSEYCVFRDADSRITKREKMAVDEWINSGKSLHVMRDHPAHGIPFGSDRLGILGGMWGIKKGFISITDMIENFTKNKTLGYGSDQTFLKSVYSIFENDRTTHDEFFEKNPFPIKRISGRFVGDRIDEFDNPVGDDYKIFLI